MDEIKIRFINKHTCLFVSGLTYCFDSFFIKPRNIRYVHIPKGMNPVTLINNVIETANTKHIHKDSKKRTFKRKRAFKYQQDILKSLNTTQTKS